MVTTGLVHVAGEVRTTGYSDVDRIVRDVIREIGYDSSEKGFDADSCGIEVSIGSQSPDIAAGVDSSWEQRDGGDGEAYSRLGAGDQGLMFGYANRKSTRLNSSHVAISYAVFCLKKKNTHLTTQRQTQTSDSRRKSTKLSVQ